MFPQALPLLLHAPWLAVGGIFFVPGIFKDFLHLPLTVILRIIEPTGDVPTGWLHDVGLGINLTIVVEAELGCQLRVYLGQGILAWYLVYFLNVNVFGIHNWASCSALCLCYCLHFRIFRYAKVKTLIVIVINLWNKYVLIPNSVIYMLLGPASWAKISITTAVSRRWKEVSLRTFPFLQTVIKNATVLLEIVFVLILHLVATRPAILTHRRRVNLTAKILLLILNRANISQQLRLLLHCNQLWRPRRMLIRQRCRHGLRLPHRKRWLQLLARLPLDPVIGLLLVKIVLVLLLSGVAVRAALLLLPLLLTVASELHDSLRWVCLYYSLAVLEKLFLAEEELTFGNVCDVGRRRDYWVFALVVDAVWSLRVFCRLVRIVFRVVRWWHRLTV